MSKILLALQFWENDRPLAMKLARLIADLEIRHSEDADFLFVSRFDCKHDLVAEKYVGRKFNTWSATSRRRATGWPHGPNELWFGTMDWIYTMQLAKKLPRYDAVFTFEADGCPMVPNWIRDLKNSWDEATQGGTPVYVYGAYLIYPAPHINGNALFSADPAFLHWLTRKVGGCAPHGGWDYVLAPQFKKWGWKNCPQIHSYWRTPTVSEQSFVDVVNQGVVYLHGVKDDSAIQICRRRYSLPVN